MQKINRPFIIGETAYNHEGDIDYLYRMINDVSDLGLDAIKFHLLLDPESYIQRKHPLLKEIHKWLFPVEKWKELLDHSIKKGLEIVALCDDVASASFINTHYPELFAIEVHSSGLNDYHLLNEVAKFKGTVILGIGGSSLDEIQCSVEHLAGKNKTDILLMYGFQSYPTDYKDINLAKMIKIRDLFSLPVGYADHTGYDDPNNEIISVMPAVMGFDILEKHYTPDFGVQRIDFHAAVGRDQMRTIRRLMDLALLVRGTGDIAMSLPELNYGNTGPTKKAIVARKRIGKGEKLSVDNLCFKRTEEQSSIRQNAFFGLIGLEAVDTIEEDEIVDFRKVKYEFRKRSLEEYTGIKK